MDLQRLDEIKQLHTTSLDGSGIRGTHRNRVEQLFDRVATALEHLLHKIEGHPDAPASTLATLPVPTTTGSADASAPVTVTTASTPTPIPDADAGLVATDPNNGKLGTEAGEIAKPTPAVDPAAPAETDPALVEAPNA